MPGIFGIITQAPKGDEPLQLAMMQKIMLHEAHYKSHTYQNEDLGIFVGATVLEDSFPGNTQFYDKKGDMILFFSGECYVNENAAIAQVQTSGLVDAQKLLSLYIEKGYSFFESLNGWFNGLIIDLGQQKVQLFNDRYGIRRIYYHQDQQAFYFSSEAKALLKILPSLRNLNLDSVAEFFVFDSVLNNKTYFKDLYIMPPASLWSFYKGHIKKTHYFHAESWEQQTKLDKHNYVKALKETFEKILPRYFNRLPVALSLTGGLDTRTILAAGNPAPGQLPCYTFGGIYRDSFDVRISRKVAAECKQPFHIFRVDYDFLEDFPTYARETIYKSDGLAEIEKAHSIYLNRKARKIAPVRMTGKFGSQVLREVSLLRDRAYNLNVIDAGFREKIDKVKENFKQIQTGRKLSFILFKEIPWYWAGFTTIELSQVLVRSPYLDNELVKLLYRAPHKALDLEDVQMNLIGEYNADLLKFKTNWGKAGNHSAVAIKIIHQIHKLLNNADKFYNWERMPHWIARIDSFFLPLHLEKLVNGFDQYTHYRTWFRDELSSYLKDVLLDHRALNRPYVNKNLLQRCVEKHTSGQGNYLNEIKKTLTLELINRYLIEEI